MCPTDCLEMSDGLPWLPRPNDCLSCAICAVVCPVDAICLELEDETSRGRQGAGDGPAC
jgi:NAD-dependent dihydropyrimidine dehydrogenase PreA subunit